MLNPVSKTNLDKVLKNIQKHSPHPSKVKIIAVTKGLSSNAIISAISNKVDNIGENRVQEFSKKKEKITNQKFKSHLIGHLQSNKIKKAVQIFNIIQTVDSLNLAKKLNQHLIQVNKKKHIFVQINIGKDRDKFGLLPEQAFYQIEEMEKMSNLIISGTMTILPYLEETPKTEKWFAEMQKLSNEIKTKISPSCSSISMGMSRDYVYALKQGSTHIRIGTLLYGNR